MQPSVDPGKELAHFLSRPGSESELATLLKALLTPAEIESISQRLCILDGIATGVPQREIAEGLRVGIATVTRGSRVWQEHRKDLGIYFPRSGQISNGLMKDKKDLSSPSMSRTVSVFGTKLPAI